MKAKSFFMAALAVVMAAACQPDQKPVDDFKAALEIAGQTAFEIPADAKTITVPVTANVSWSVECSESWVSVEPATFTNEDKEVVTTKVTIKVSANESEENGREASVKVGAEGLDVVTVTIKQAAKEHVYKTITVFDVDKFEAVENYSISVKAVAAPVTFAVDAEADWTIECPEWITVDPKSNVYTDNSLVNVTATFAVNNGAPRTGEIVFKGDFEKDLVIPVSQADMATIALECTGVTTSTVAFSAVPSDKEMLYCVMCETTDYVGQFGSDEELLQGEVEYFQYLADNNDMTLAEVIEIFAYQGDAEDEFTDYDSDTDYVLYAYGITLEGEITTACVKVNVHTAAPSFAFAGTAVWHDVFVDEWFSLSADGYAVDMPCDVYTDESTPGTYYFHAPYNYANIAGWFDSTPEEMKQYTGNWKEVYIAINCADPNEVHFNTQELGVSLSSNYGWFSAGAEYQGQVISTGILADNKIQFNTVKGMLKSMDKYNNGGLYYANTDANNLFHVDLKLDKNATPVYPGSVAPASVNAARMSNINKKNAKSINSSIAKCEKVR